MDSAPVPAEATGPGRDGTPDDQAAALAGDRAAAARLRQRAGTDLTATPRDRRPPHERRQA